MDIDKFLTQLNNLLIAKGEKELSPRDQKIIQDSWAGKTYEDMNIPGYTTDYIKKMAAPSLWKKLSNLTGQRVTKKNLRLVLESLSKPSSSIPEPTESSPLLKLDLSDAPYVSDFYGRTNELAQLEQWIVTDHSPLVAIFGITGIGKTALSVKLVEQIKDQFEYVIWRSLKDTPSVEEVLSDLIQFFSNHQENPSSTTLNNLLSRLMYYLNQHRCLVVLDEVEAIMDAGESSGIYKEGYQDYRKLLQCIGEKRHQSCLLLTSQEPPQEVKELVIRQGRIREFQLKGLKKEDAKALLSKDGISKSLHGVGQLIDSYKGHPLALKIAVRTIQNCHNGKISDFLKGSLFIGDVLINMFDKQFSLLSDFDQELMNHLAMATEPVSTQYLLAQFSSYPNRASSEIKTSINNLLQRSLIEKTSQDIGEVFFNVEPVIKNYLNKRLY
ncbi:MAG: AAA family ATPase [Moorea sp. SIOASIH]|uniref:NB-ARC domain-containing protein n=1 Tax=Moorena sp. SIOASIH TaxID=2607817 RepID=UPI0013B70FCA|nr:NB-ARC domain-containing protein [Moorena sp. SIOASIH]NEO41314.1 AAA family ATPase [Moorena sp. SIOASIH]